MARVFGFTFAAKLMDKRKVKVEHHAKKLLDEVPEVGKLEARPSTIVTKSSSTCSAKAAFHT